MNTVQSRRATYAAAFILGALIALLVASPARSAEPFRLDRIGVTRFTAFNESELWRHAGVLDQDGRVTWRNLTPIQRPANTPEWALNRILVRAEAWSAYRQLGQSALENFELTDGMVQFQVGEDRFYFVAASPMASIATGSLVNISTRAWVGPGSIEVVAGFVIVDRPRMVLVRAVGPSLARFGVAGATPDPSFVVRHNGLVVGGNSSWYHHPEAGLIRVVTARVGAFPLDEGSRDAAHLLVLLPGAYTVHVHTATQDTPAGNVLVEVYSVPDEVFITYADGATPAQP
jgi:hypothetical protein